MKNITMTMINLYNIRDFDFMGYEVNKESSLTFHHLIVPKRHGGPETIKNGAILVRETSHDYAHLIERIDLEIFNRITSEMIDENIKGYIATENVKNIDGLLTYFEREHYTDTSKKGHYLIKEEYMKRKNYK